MKLESFASSKKFNTGHGNHFLVKDAKGRSGVFDATKKILVVPCKFEDIEPTDFPNLWEVTEHGRYSGEDFGSKGIAGVFNSAASRFIIPTICEQAVVYNSNWIVITVASQQFFRWRKIGLYSVRNKKLYMDTNYEKKWIPTWPGMKIVPTLFPASRLDSIEIIAHDDDILVVDMYDVPRIFSRKLRKIIYPIEKK